MSSLTKTRGRKDNSKWKIIAPLLLVCLFGFGVRLFSLEGQSLWSDEGLSLYRSGQPLKVILQNIIVVDGVPTQDTSPPFYFLLLHFWRILSGDTVFAMRFLSVASGTISIPLMYVLGRRVFDYWAGLTAAFLMALSPFHVWQSQVLRNYSLLVTLNLVAVYALYRFLISKGGRPQRKWFTLWLAASLIGIYTHYFGFFVFAFGFLSIIISNLKRLKFFRPKIWWLGLVLAGLAVIPVASIALERFKAGQQIDFYFVPLPSFLAQAASAFSVGMSSSLVHEWWRVMPVVFLALVGLWLGLKCNRSSTIFLAGYQVIPMGILFSLSFINPLFNGTRHLLIGLPPFLILVAGGVTLSFQAVRRKPRLFFGRFRLVAVLVIAIFSVFSQIEWLYEQFTSPALVRDDIRGAAEYLNKVVSPDDLIILHDTLIRFTFEYYYHGQAPVTAVPLFNMLDPEQAIATLQKVGQQANRVWFLTEPEPRNGFERELLSGWADDNWDNLYERRFPHMWLPVKLAVYNVESILDAPPSTAAALNGIWPGYFNLQGFEVLADIYSGNDVWMTFYWDRTADDIPVSPALSIRLTDMSGDLWAQWDQPFQNEGFLPADWPLEATVRYDHRLKAPAGLPPGQYQLWLRLVNPDNSQPIPLADGSFDLHLSDVFVQPATCESDPELWPPHTTADVGFGRRLTLRGFQLPGNEYRPGHTIAVQALWCVRHQPDKDYMLRLQLIDEQGEVAAESFNSLTRADYPPTGWQKDQLLMSQAKITIPAAAKAGTYEMQLSVVDPETKEPLSVGGLFSGQSFSLGTVEIVAWPLISELPAIQFPIRADFGQPTIVELHGYDLDPIQPGPGENLTLTLVWQSRSSTIPASYSVFVHLEDETGNIIAQGDGLPVYGFRPTTSWREGEVIVDEHIVTIPDGAVPGTYRLWVGFYDPETNLRPPLVVDGVVQPDGRLLLTEVLVGP